MDGPYILTMLRDHSHLGAHFSWNGHLNRNLDGQQNTAGSPECQQKWNYAVGLLLFNLKDLWPGTLCHYLSWV